jgi:ABC-type branched-subunit amino acid transport system substrate-binding protein
MLPALPALEGEGRRIFRTGRAAGPEITAVLGGEGGTEVSATTLPCAGCHGRDGRGRPEGGLVPPDITWDVLTRPYGDAGTSGRRHPAYDTRTLKRAITLGIDAGGNVLLGAMPRYRLSQDQAAALITYLQVLGREVDPGVTADRVRVGVLLPAGPEAAVVRADLDAYATRLERAGGIYGRRLDLRYLAAAGLAGEPSPAERRRQVERFIAEQAPFALAASSFAGAEEALAEMAADLEVPVVGALTAEPWQGGETGRYVFYLQSGLADQARALVQAAAASAKGGASAVPRLGLLAPRGAENAAPAAEGDGGAVVEAAAATRDECGRLGIEAWTASYAPGGTDLAAQVAAARRAGVEALVFLGAEGEARALLAQTSALGWQPRIYLLAELAAGALSTLPAAYAGRIFLAAPGLPSDLAPHGEELLGRAGPPGKTSPGGVAGPPGSTLYRRAALAAMEVLRDALTRGGRDLDRDRLVTALEGLRGFQTGLWPPISFGPQRRVGALGAYVVSYDARRQSFTPVGGWITPR